MTNNPWEGRFFNIQNGHERKNLVWVVGVDFRQGYQIENKQKKTMKNMWIHLILANPIPSMYGIFTYIWLIFMVNVGKYTIHGLFGNTIWPRHLFSYAVNLKRWNKCPEVKVFVFQQLAVRTAVFTAVKNPKRVAFWKRASPYFKKI